MRNLLNYIIVDDDPTNNMVVSMLLKMTLGKVKYKAFTKPEDGLQYIENNFDTNSENTILFLDLNMPTLSGWQFLEQYENFGEEVKMKINIYLLSSSIDKRDWEKSNKNQCVQGFLIKPIFPEAILSIAAKKFSC